MDTQKNIVAEAATSPKGNQVWKVYVKGSRSKKNISFCISPKNAMRFAFLLKQRTGHRIDDTALALLMAEHAKMKALTEAPAEA